MRALTLALWGLLACGPALPLSTCPAPSGKTIKSPDASRTGSGNAGERT